ncbi:LON peptidase substrate-binding domain-containing protein [Beijerinckia indica]|uniref:Endopeptidase La n=1 Tax=Beijerinckia indica subsp. indica (strain ATCC 9039 / DSM 1715 / NCIMB 8712) TaxID=395963 RepID=B2IEI1_BEII9|nr:LON peptidase substrate-binding domain-containing protein [Beijerinckia indica]ACB95579.1 Endopeptidase La [Beijerinckia indica subsp. indica ATCC 9039]
MRDFRDAKAMAQTLRENLTAKAITISYSESLELVSKILGISDWNTLSALLQARLRETASPPTRHPGGTVNYPALPIRDFVVFPTMNVPLLVGRDKTKHALDHAFERHREVVLAVQKDPAIEEPGFGDVYEVGVLARLLELERFPDSTMKILVHAHRRVAICGFIGEAGAFQAEIADISEGPIPDAPELIRKVVERFERYVAVHEIDIPQTWPALGQIRDPGRVADVISQHMAMPISKKQSLLATLDPVIRLEKVVALLDGE